MLTAESFKTYPPKGRALAVANLPLLQGLPIAFLPFLLRELIVYDWKFPIEQAELAQQVSYLTELGEQRRGREMQPFASLKLAENLENSDWIGQPAQFLERLSAHLWATHQMDGFRAASELYVRKLNASLNPSALPVPRLGIAVFGKDVTATQYKLFRKLRRNGVYFSRVNPAKGMEVIGDALSARAAANPDPYAHWCISGAEVNALPGFACVSYDALAPIRAKLAAMMLAAYESSSFDPEKLRTNLAEATPASVGMTGSGDGALDRFQLTLLTEGSGTQIYSTTFVQWAAREALRRAQPLTLFTRYAPRQRERTMDELLAGAEKKLATDREGSLIDGDMAAFYTWVNMQRLPESANARFLAWFEGHTEAVAIAPGLRAGTTDDTAIDLAGLLSKIAKAAA